MRIVEVPRPVAHRGGPVRSSAPELGHGTSVHTMKLNSATDNVQVGPEKVLAVCHIRILDLVKLPKRRKDQWFALLHPTDERGEDNEQEMDATLAWMEQLQLKAHSRTSTSRENDDAAEDSDDGTKVANLKVISDDVNSNTPSSATSEAKTENPSKDEADSPSKMIFHRTHSLERQHVENTLSSVKNQDVIRLCVTLTGTGGTFKSTVISAHQVCRANVFSMRCCCCWLSALKQWSTVLVLRNTF